MNNKTLILIIILSVLIGTIIFFGSKFLDHSPLASTTLFQTPVTNSNDRNFLLPSSIPPFPKPSLIPIGPNTNLKEEIDILTPPDFSEDINKLKQELNN